MALFMLALQWAPDPVVVVVFNLLPIGYHVQECWANFDFHGAFVHSPMKSM